MLTSPLAAVDAYVVQTPESAGLTRALGLWEVTTITAGTILGSAIFVAAAFVPRAVPHPALVLLAWVVGGLIAIAGALSYAELGTMFPEAGGQYHYLKQAFGPLWGFLFGWTALLAIQASGSGPSSRCSGSGWWRSVFRSFSGTDVPALRDGAINRQA